MQKIIAFVRPFILEFMRIFWAIKEEFLNFREIRRFDIKPYQLLWVNPGSILMSKCKANKDCIDSFQDKFIQGGEWDSALVSPLDHNVVRASFKVSSNNKSWRVVGEYERMDKLINTHGAFDNCRSQSDIKDRYGKLDKMISEIGSNKSIQSRKMLRKFNFRELGGIEVAISRNGQIVKIGDGQHRLGIALGLGIEIIPVSVILVHSSYHKGQVKQCLKK
jgi:hypothetical protein